MKCNFWKRAAAVVVAVCVGVTFIPLAGEYAVFAADGDDQVLNEQPVVEGETPQDVAGDPSAEVTDPAGESGETASTSARAASASACLPLLTNEKMKSL